MSASAPGVKSVYDALISPYALYRGMDGQAYLFTNISPVEIIRKYEEVAPLYIAVTKIANAVASLPLQLVDRGTQEPDPSHPAFLLLSQPNKELQRIRQEFIRDFVIWRVLAGNVFLLLTGPKNRPPLELYFLNPQDMDADPDERGFIGSLKYSFGANGQETFAKDRATGTYRSSNFREVYHVANFNPKFSEGDLFGKSEVTSLFYEINHYIHASQHNLSLLSNGARPSGAFILKSKDGSPAILSDEAFARLKAQIHSEYAGAANSGKMLVLEGGLEFKEMQMTPRDLDFANLKDKSEEKIYQALGVPIQLVMSIKTTANNMSNVRLEFFENRVLPLADEVCEHLNNAILMRFGKEEYARMQFIVDRDNIDVLIKSRAERRKSIETSIILTIDEKRKEFRKGPIEGGNKITDPNGRPIAGPDAETTVGAANSTDQPEA